MSEEKVKSAGIITVKTTRETRPYLVVNALDTKTGEMLSAELAFGKSVMLIILQKYDNIMFHVVFHRLNDVVAGATKYLFTTMQRAVTWSQGI